MANHTTFPQNTTFLAWLYNSAAESGCGIEFRLIPDENFAAATITTEDIARVLNELVISNGYGSAQFMGGVLTQLDISAEGA